MQSKIKPEDIAARFSAEDLKQEIILSKDSRQLEDYDINEEYTSEEQPALFDSYQKTATKHQWFYSAVCRISQSGAQIPMKLFRWDKKNGTGIEIKDHPLLDLLEHPYPQGSGYDLKEAIYSYLEIAGNAYLEKVPLKKGNIKGEIKELFPIRPSKITAVPSRKKRILRYEYGSKPVIYEQEEIVHFRKFNPTSDLYGLAPILPLRNSVLSDLYAQKWNINIFKHGGKFSGIFSTKEKLSDESFNRTFEQIKSKYAGVDNANKFIFSDGGLEFSELGKTQQDMEYAKLREANFEEISGGLSVYPIILGILRNANYSNAETQTKLFWNLGMIPRAWKYAFTLTTQLCWHYGDDLYFEPDLEYIKNLLRDETREREIDISEINSGIVLINEVRQRRGLAKVPWGDTWNMPFSLLPYSVSPTPTAASKSLDGDRREKAWRVFDASLKPFEKKIIYLVNSYHKKLQAAVLANIGDKYTQKTKLPHLKKDRFDDMLFDLDQAIKELEKMSTGIFMDTFDWFGNKAVKTIQSAIDFDLSNPKVLELIDKKAFKFADEVLKTTRDQLREELKAGYDAGEGIGDIKVRVQNVFEGTIRADGGRAETIARTEVVSAANQASLAGYKQVGVAKKEWLATKDQATRDTHASADGQIVGIDEKFKVGGEELDSPGDPNGSPDNIINCRCAISPVVD